MHLTAATDSTKHVTVNSFFPTHITIFTDNIIPMCVWQNHKT